MAIVLALAALLVLFVAKPGYVLKLGLVLVLLCLTALGAVTLGGLLFGPIRFNAMALVWPIAGLLSVGGLRALLK